MPCSMATLRRSSSSACARSPRLRQTAASARATSAALVAFATAGSSSPATVRARFQHSTTDPSSFASRASCPAIRQHSIARGGTLATSARSPAGGPRKGSRPAITVRRGDGCPRLPWSHEVSLQARSIHPELRTSPELCKPPTAARCGPALFVVPARGRVARPGQD